MTGFLDTPAADAAAAERFWPAVTGTTLSARRGGGTFATLLPAAGDANLRVQVVGDPPARAHLDLHVGAVPAAAARVRELGAALLYSEDDLVVLRSPAGIVFCLVPWSGERAGPAAPVWPGGHASVADQLCLDIPDAAYDREFTFWRAVTGWRADPVDSPEFERLLPPPPIPMRLLLQRLQSGPAGVHLDLACSDVAAEVARHEALGATVVRRVPGDWTTLRDPAGREYCVTARPPS
ncbi:VOC family protein [Actinoplanes ianthinogenes]|uniref:VOC family protein n=1 Tax=Actinoplanes ianthinogenes TaxID=122358 RepID=UPI001E4E02CA|nr:VOC family protein [Actinoplanes ianthinogenes]